MKSRWTLFVKIQVLVIAILLISYIAVEVIILNLIGNQMKERFIDSAKSTITLMQRNIEIVFSDVNERIEYLGGQSETFDKGSEEVQYHLRALGLSNIHMLQTFIAYDDGSWDMIPPSDNVSSGFDPRERDWYKRAFRSHGVKWSDPYVDEVSGGKVITGSIYTKLADSEAVTGMDISLSGLTAIFRDIDISENDVVALLNDNDRIIASNEETFNDKTLETFNDEEMTGHAIITGEVETAKGLYYFRRLNQSQMRLMVFLPRQDIIGTTSQAQWIMTIVITVILIVSIALSQSITRRVMRPLTALRDTMIQSRGEGELLLYDENANDEINAVIKAYNNLAAYINEQNEEISRMAYQDELTGLPNRASFMKSVNSSLSRCENLALFYLDLDNFKYVNDTYGHAYGDVVLKSMAESLTDFCGKRCAVARLSGDEFAAIMVNYADERELDAEAKHILRLVKQPIFLDDIEFTLTGSLGVSRYPIDGKDYETLLSNADIAMYEAKGNNSDQYSLYNEAMRNDYMEQLRLERRLVRSIENNEFDVVYQPILYLPTKEVCGFEALSRWNDELLGPVSPDVFIPIAERNQFISVIGKYVLEQSVALGRKLFNQYGRYYELNVNVSVVQMQSETFVDEVLNILDASKYPSRFLNLEITESLTLESDEHVLMRLAYLRKKGIQISIDDFGTGYSSLGHMTDLSLTHVKIDRQLIMKASQSQEIFQLMKGIVEFAHTMLYKVVAEGIEDEHMEAMVEEMNSDFAQGYKYAKPLYEEQLIDYLKEHRPQQ